MSEDLANVEDIEEAWRPLNAAEKARARHYIGRATRKIRRRFPDVDTRLAATDDSLSADDVKDVVVALVMSVVPAPVAGARQWSQTSGPFSHAVTMPASTAAVPMSWEDWMIEVFDPSARQGSAVAFFFPDAEAWPDAPMGGWAHV